jgi:putative membrane protein
MRTNGFSLATGEWHWSVLAHRMQPARRRMLISKENLMTTSSRLLLAGAIAFTGVALAQTSGGSNAPKQPSEGAGADAAFIQKAGAGGMAEVELSKLAEQNAKSGDVKKFAEHMVRDHTSNNRELETIATKENVALPKDLDAEHAALRDKLASLKDEAFDKAYIDAMRDDHQKMDDLLKSSAGSVSSAELRTYIKKTEPAVEAHLREANKLKE